MTLLYIEPPRFNWTIYSIGWTEGYRSFGDSHYYPCDDEWRWLVAKWRNECSFGDLPPFPCLISGVLADWIEDRRSELLTDATGPSDPAVRLDELIQYLRNRFNPVQ